MLTFYTAQLVYFGTEKDIKYAYLGSDSFAVYFCFSVSINCLSLNLVQKRGK